MTKQLFVGAIACVLLSACAPSASDEATQTLAESSNAAAITACDPSATDAAKKFSTAAQAYQAAQSRSTLEKLVEACGFLEQALGARSCQIKLDDKSEPAPISFESKKNDCLSFKSALEKIKKDEDEKPVAKLPPPPATHPMDKKPELKKLSLKVYSMSLLRRVMSNAEDGYPPRALVEGEAVLRPAMFKAVNEKGKVGCWLSYNKATLQDGSALTFVLRTKAGQVNPQGHLSIGFAFETPDKELVSLVCIAKGRYPSAKEIRLSLYGALDIVSYE